VSIFLWFCRPILAWFRCMGLQCGKVGSLLWSLAQRCGPSGLAPIRPYVNLLYLLSLPRPTKEWPYDLLGPWASREVFYPSSGPGGYLSPTVVYYETDSSSPSTSGSDAASITSKRQEHKKYSNIRLRYPRIPRHTPLLSVPLGKPPTFDNEDYSRWSDMMRYHLTSLHKSIWDVVEFRVQVPSVGG
jgi:hypothetical protein